MSIEPLFFKLSCTQTHTHTDGHGYSIVAVDKPQLSSTMENKTVNLLKLWYLKNFQMEGVGSDMNHEEQNVTLIINHGEQNSKFT